MGATDNADVVAGTSSRGPDACGGTSVTFPDIVAPGVNIRTTDTSGLYASGTGTSFAAPHVVGALALLLDVFGSLTPDEQDAALRAGAVDLGTPGPDNAFGSGRLDVLRAYQSLHVDPPPPPAPPSWQLSLVENGSVGGLAFADEDILSYDGSAFAMHVDGSDVGLGGPAVDVDAVERLPDGGILLSFASALHARSRWAASTTPTSCASTPRRSAPPRRAASAGTSTAPTSASPALARTSTPSTYCPMGGC